MRGLIVGRVHGVGPVDERFEDERLVSCLGREGG